MKRQMLGILAVVALLASLMGVALANDDHGYVATGEGSQPRVSVPNTDRIVNVTLAEIEPTSEESTTSSSLLDDNDDHNATTSTSADDDDDWPEDDSSTTATTFHDEGSEDTDHDGYEEGQYEESSDDAYDSDDDHDESETKTTTTVSMNEQTIVHDIAGVGSVTLKATGSYLSLVSINAPGWTTEVSSDSDEVEVKFFMGSAEYEFEAELEHGMVQIEVEKK